MARILLTSQEKRAARRMLESTWDASQLTQAAIEKAATPWGINPREAYMSLIHLDTLDALRGLDFLVFKGGTCVQTYLPPGYQRISVDLDFNSHHPHPNTVDAAISDVNKALTKAGRAGLIQGIPFGSLVPFAQDKHTGTVSYARYLYTPYDERAIVGGNEVQARMMRVQINLKHFELPAIDPAKREVAFFTQETLKPKRVVQAECASTADLFADKVLTITKNVGGFGRERIKDFYDLFALRRLKIPYPRAVEKLDRIATKANATRNEILDGAIERCEDVRSNYAEVKGYVTSACKDGKALLADWEAELEKLQDALRGMRAA